MAERDFVQSAFNYANATSAAVSFPGSVTAGNTLVVAQYFPDGDSGDSVTDSKSGNTYTPISVGTGYARLWLCPVVTGGASFQITVSRVAFGLVAVEIFEFEGTLTLDQKAEHVQNSTSYDSTATPSTTVADELLFGAVLTASGNFGFAYPITPAGWTSPGGAQGVTFGYSLLSSYKLVSAAGAQQYTGALTTGTPTDNGASVITLKGPGGGGPAFMPSPNKLGMSQAVHRSYFW